MDWLKKHGWKALSILLLFYSFSAGFLTPVPRLAILNETIRNLYFHVPMWFGMTFLLILSASYSVLYLYKKQENADLWAVETANTAMAYGILGLLTGMVWAKNTWGAFWTSDPKLNAVAIGMLMYLAYFVLRGSLKDEQQRARVSAVYNIFAFPTFCALIYILPRMTDSLHPGNGGNPGFNKYDRDSTMNIIFYSANVGFILLGIWITLLRVRIAKLKMVLDENE